MLLDRPATPAIRKAIGRIRLGWNPPYHNKMNAATTAPKRVTMTESIPSSALGMGADYTSAYKFFD
jgi:hypothetical protein